MGVSTWSVLSSSRVMSGRTDRLPAASHSLCPRFWRRARWHLRPRWRRSILAGFPPDEGMIEARNIAARRIHELYDVELGIYSTAVHLVANRMRLSVLEDAYALAGPLASLCLNVPDELFDGLRIPKDFEPWGDNNEAAIRQRDRGYLYMLLGFHARKDLVGQPARWIENAARRAGLPPLSDIEPQSATAMREALDGAIDGPYRERLEQIAQLGIRVHRELGAAITLPGTLRSMETVVMPPIVCRDLGVEGLSPENVVHFEDWVRRMQPTTKANGRVCRGVRILTSKMVGARVYGAHLFEWRSGQGTVAEAAFNVHLATAQRLAIHDVRSGACGAKSANTAGYRLGATVLPTPWSSNDADACSSARGGRAVADDGSSGLSMKWPFCLPCRSLSDFTSKNPLRRVSLL